MNIQVEKSYRIFFSKGNLNNKKIHVLAIVDSYYIVYKYWSKYKQRWHYQVEHENYFNMLIKNNQITSK